jgi:hypothetical protein
MDITEQHCNMHIWPYEKKGVNQLQNSTYLQLLGLVIISSTGALFLNDIMQ